MHRCDLLRPELIGRVAGMMLLVLVAAFGGSAFAQTVAGVPQPLITQPVNASNLVVLSGNTRPDARNPANDLGLAPASLPMEHLELQLRRSAAQEQALATLIDQLHDPNSPNYHHWLSAAEFGVRFGVAQSDIAIITGWLQQQGFTVNYVYPSRMLIDFSGTAAQAGAAFHTAIHNINVNGVARFANVSDPQIPAALAPAVAGVVSLSNIPPHKMVVRRPQYTVSGCGYFSEGATDCYPLVPADLATIYNINPVFSGGNTGQGQTIYLIEDTDLYGGTSGGTNSDWQTFRSALGLTAYSGATVNTVHPSANGGSACTDPGVNGDDDEAILDAEWATAAAPSAAIVMATCADTATFGGLIAVQNLVDGANPPAIISMSYGECEAAGSASSQAFASAFQQGVAEGASIFVSAGDQDASVCDNGVSAYGIAVNGFGSSQYNVAVGGTDFSDTYSGTNSTFWSANSSATYESALSYVPEIPWNNTCASTLIAQYLTGSSVTYGDNGLCNNSTETGTFFALLSNQGGSGGPSTLWSKPSWQSGFIGIVSDGARDLPDVSLFAANGVWNHYYVYCLSDPENEGNGCSGAPINWNGAGGTSFASPIWAGFQALINEKTGARQGNPNPRLYQLAATEYGASGSSACNSSNGNGVSGSCIFYDVTLGDNDAPCYGTGFPNCYAPGSQDDYGVLSTSTTAYEPAYAATTGWDFATGIGTVNVANLVNAWSTTTRRLSDSHDFNGDGTSDILWRQSGTGVLAMWLMSAGQMSSGATLGNVGGSWSVAGTRDFNGDGDADILWLDGSGDLAVWLMNGATLSSGIGLGNVGTQWQVAGTGDFNGDGTGDILWRDGSGDVAIWLMSNGQLSSGVSLGQVGSAWSVAGTGDFNGDGTTDILWHNTATGDYAIWLLSNGQMSSGADLGVVGGTWSVVGTGDFNGDGTSDILWRDGSGDLAIWLMSNGQFSSGSTIAQVPTQWSVAETGDFNGDGKSDILWLCTTSGGSCSVGDLAVWLMNGTSLSSGIGLGNVGASWQVQGLNAD